MRNVNLEWFFLLVEEIDINDSYMCISDVCGVSLTLVMYL